MRVRVRVEIYLRILKKVRKMLFAEALEGWWWTLVKANKITLEKLTPVTYYI